MKTSSLSRNGYSLMDESIQIQEVPAIKLRIRDGVNRRCLFVDAFGGSYSKLFSFIPTYSESPTALEIECPICWANLVIEKECSLGNCSSMKAVQLKLSDKNGIIACFKLDCPGYIME